MTTGASSWARRAAFSPATSPCKGVLSGPISLQLHIQRVGSSAPNKHPVCLLQRTKARQARCCTRHCYAQELMPVPASPNIWPYALAV